jgi:hypothetical protein
MYRVTDRNSGELIKSGFITKAGANAYIDEHDLINYAEVLGDSSTKKFKVERRKSKMPYKRKSAGKKRTGSKARKVKVSGKRLAVIHVIVPASPKRKKKATRRKTWW